MIKYITTSILALFLMSGCSKPDQVTNDNETQNSVKKPKYLAAMYAGYPPFNFRDDKGLPVGFDVDLMNEVAKSQDFEIEYLTTVSWEDLERSVNTGQRDLIVSSYWYSDDRAKNFELSEPYYSSAFVLMGKKSENQGVVSADSVKNKKIAFISGNTYHDVLFNDIFAKDNTPVKSKTTYFAFRKLLRGDADYVLGTEGSLHYYTSQAKKSLDDYVFLKSEKLPTPQWVYVAKKGNTELIDKLNAGLSKVKNQGTYKKIEDKWFVK